MFEDFFRGARYVGRGADIIQQAQLRRFIVIPILINLFIFIGLIWFSGIYFSSLIDTFLPTWLDWAIIQFILWTFFAVLSIVIFAYTFTIIANFIAAPFNSLLAEKTERYLTGQDIEGSDSIAQLIASIPVTMASEFRKLLYLVLWMIPLLIISFMPVLNIISPLVWLLFSAWLLALEYTDYPMGNHGYTFGTIKTRMKKDRPLALGFGGAMTIFTSIPVVNILAMPIGVAGATAMWVDEISNGADTPARRTKQSNTNMSNPDSPNKDIEIT